MIWKRIAAHVSAERRIAAPALLLVALLLVACGTPVPSPVPTSTPAATTPPAPAITLDDNGKAISLQVGERFLLDLGEGYDWAVTVANPAIVSRVVNVTVIRGAQGLYEAHESGTTTLMAVGDPVCRQAQPPCAAPSIQFMITIVVQ